MDAFQEAVEEARRQLSFLEERPLSISELVRRSNLPEGRRASVFYHLDAKRARKRGHHVPPDIVHALADVLMVPVEQLAAAARKAAGFQQPVEQQPTEQDSGVLDTVARFLGDPRVDEAMRDEVADQLLELIAQERRRRRLKTEGENGGG